MSEKYGIIGGGIVGASIAYHLTESTEAEVVLFERQSPASETTYKSVAQFGYYGNEVQYRMKQYGMRLYNEFFANPRANPRYNAVGHLFTATEEDNAAKMRNAVEGSDPGESDLGLLGEGFDRDLVDYVDGDELLDHLLLPPIEVDEIAGALYRPNVGYLNRPQEIAYEFLERAKENGASVRANQRVTEIRTRGGRASGVVVDGDAEVDLDHVVCAAGPWNVELARSVGVDLPVKHTLGPVLLLERTDVAEYTLPIVDHYESPFALHRRSPDEFLIGYIPETPYEEAQRYDPETVSETVPEDLKRDGVAFVRQLAPDMLDAGISEEWVGVRSITPDGNPIVGWTDVENFSVAAFHTSGIQLAPYVGKMIAEQLTTGEPDELYDQLSISRFDGYTDCRS